MKFRQAEYWPDTSVFRKFHYWGFIGGCLIYPKTARCSIAEAKENSHPFTGLVDNNGKDIYPGDFFLDGEEVCLVQWCETTLSWIAEGYHSLGVCSLYNLRDNISIIGNVYADQDRLDQLIGSEEE